MPHIHELYDFVVSVFIVHDDKVLLVHHPRYDKWIPMGGHIELNEDPEDAVYREIKEETGLRVTILNEKPSLKTNDTKFILTPSFMDVHEANAPHKHIALVYFALAEDNKYKLSAEHDEINWVSKHDLHSRKYNLSPSVKFYCQQAINAARKSRK